MDFEPRLVEDYCLSIIAKANDPQCDITYWIQMAMPLSRRTFFRASGAAALAAVWSRFAYSRDLGTNALCGKLASDPLRPQYHLLPSHNWMNDPNGPIFFHGRYHMFHQYNPEGATWGNMNWAHATSLDLIHWKNEPIAMSPTPGGPDRDGVFSG